MKTTHPIATKHGSFIALVIIITRLIWSEKDVSNPFITMLLTNATVVRWADVPHSDCGDFRRRRAVDISSYSTVIILEFPWYQQAMPLHRRVPMQCFSRRPFLCDQSVSSNF